MKTNKEEKANANIFIKEDIPAPCQTSYIKRKINEWFG